MELYDLLTIQNIHCSFVVFRCSSVAVCRVYIQKCLSSIGGDDKELKLTVR